MAANEKFNKITEEIDRQAFGEIKTAKDIAYDIARMQGLQPRDLSSVFNYLADISLHAYITSRKLMAAYKYLISDKNPEILRAVEIADYSDQPSFTKAFKRFFALTPKEAISLKDHTLIKKPLCWEMLSSDFASESYVKEKKLQEKAIFGVSEDCFNKISKALDLGAFYGFSTMFSNYAFEIAEKTGHTLEEAFEYVDSLREYDGDFDGDPEGLSSEEALHEAGDNETIQKVFFERKISVSIISELLFNYAATENDLMHCTMEMLNLFPGFENNVDMSFSYYVKAYVYYSERLPIDTEDYYWFDKYLDKILANIPIEIAFDEIYPFVASALNIENGDYSEYTAFNPKAEKQIMEDYAIIDAMEDEEEKWHGIRIDDKYDPDNVGFEKLDREDYPW